MANHIFLDVLHYAIAQFSFNDSGTLFPNQFNRFGFINLGLIQALTFAFNLHLTLFHISVNGCPQIVRVLHRIKLCCKLLTLLCAYIYACVLCDFHSQFITQPKEFLEVEFV